LKPPRPADGVAWLCVTALLCVGAIVAWVGGGERGVSPWSHALAWRAGGELDEPWRLWSGAWVHWSWPHLIVNLVGTLVVGAVGWRARAPTAAALAWFIAWPLTQGLLALPDGASMLRAMPTYGGLSGVLHAGVAVLGLTLLWPRRPRAMPAFAAPRAESGFAATRTPLAEPSRITEGPWAMTSLEELSAASTVLPGSAFEATPELAPTPAQARRHRWIGAAILAGTLAKVLLETPWDIALRPSVTLGIQVAPLAHACGITAGAIAWGLVTWWTALAPRRPGYRVRK
jgi:hypothetical protein